MRPERLRVSEDGETLLVDWPEGRTDAIPARRLRANARDAASVRARHDHGAVALAEDLAIVGMEAVGAMGVNLRFSDGHDRGIYPWPWLRALAEGPDAGRN